MLNCHNLVSQYGLKVWVCWVTMLLTDKTDDSYQKSSGNVVVACNTTETCIEISEVPKECNFSSTQAISPQYLNVLASNWMQRFFRELGIFACTTSFVTKYLPQSKIQAIFRHTTLLINKYCWSIKTQCDAAHSHLNIQQVKVRPVLYTKLVAQWYSTGVWLEPCSNFSRNATIYCHKIPFLSKSSTRIILDI